MGIGPNGHFETTGGSLGNAVHWNCTVAAVVGVVVDVDHALKTLVVVAVAASFAAVVVGSSRPSFVVAVALTHDHQFVVGCGIVGWLVERMGRRRDIPVAVVVVVASSRAAAVDVAAVASAVGIAYWAGPIVAVGWVVVGGIVVVAVGADIGDIDGFGFDYIGPVVAAVDMHVDSLWLGLG